MLGGEAKLECDQKIIQAVVDSKARESLGELAGLVALSSQSSHFPCAPRPLFRGSQSGIL